jgi:hypothetical protein
MGRALGVRTAGGRSAPSGACMADELQNGSGAEAGGDPYRPNESRNTKESRYSRQRMEINWRIWSFFRAILGRFQENIEY